MKIDWHGQLTSVQPRFRLGRSYDQRHHEYLGFALRVRGQIDGEQATAWFGVGRAAHQKHGFQVGQEVSGQAEPVADPRAEVVDYYKVSRLTVSDGPSGSEAPPLWRGVPPPIEVYRERGHRRLAARTYASQACSSCIWGAHMAVELIVDHWNPGQKKYRTETFCYGPKSCRVYKPGPTRKVPGRRGMTFDEGDWVDEEETAHRGPDD
ncbi:MAG: hypothetical protein ACQGVK_14370 [Myxococcota bacterium]